MNNNHSKFSRELPQGFDQRFFAKLDRAKAKAPPELSPLKQPRFLSSLKGALFPLAFAFSMIVFLYTQTKSPLPASYQLDKIVQEIDGDISELGDENWDILLQVASNI
jgi:hypothetical protein